MDKLKSCPHCENDDVYYYIDWGVGMRYVGFFGRGRSSEENTDMIHTRPAPKFAKCGGCGKQIKLSKLRGEAHGD